MSTEQVVARKLLAVEKGNVRDSRVTARRVIEAAIARIALSTSFDDKVDARAAMRAVTQAIPAMTSELAATLETIRVAARDAGRDSASEDFENEDIAPDVQPSEEDGARAWAAAAAFASFWGATALVNVKKAVRARVAQGTTVRRAMVATARDTAPRLERIVVTETVHAFNIEREAVAIEVKQAPTLVPINGGPYRVPGMRAPVEVPSITKTWSAILDGATCQRCASLNGTVRDLEDDFPEGLTPPAHPFCRCIVVYDKRSLANAA